MHLVTVLNTIAETSMPYNEFVLYRAKNDPSVSQTVLVCSGKIPDTVSRPDNVKIIVTGENPVTIRKATKKILNDACKNGDSVVFHLHQAASAALFLTATRGLHVKHRSLFTMHTQYTALSKKNRIFNRIAVHLAAKTVCVSRPSYNAYPKKMRDKAGKRMTEIVNGVDISRIEQAVAGETKPQNDVAELVYVARIIPLKNHDFLLSVLKELPDAKLLLIGADASGDFSRKINEMGLSGRVEMAGLMPRDEVFRRIYRSDIYVSSSTVEGLPVSVLEAMCCSLPLVLSDIDPHKEIADMGDFAVTLPFDKDDWVSALRRLIDMPHSERSALGEKGRECALNHFSLQAMHDKYSAVYSSLAN